MADDEQNRQRSPEKDLKKSNPRATPSIRGRAGFLGSRPSTRRVSGTPSLGSSRDPVARDASRIPVQATKRTVPAKMSVTVPALAPDANTGATQPGQTMVKSTSSSNPAALGRAQQIDETEAKTTVSKSGKLAPVTKAGDKAKSGAVTARVSHTKGGEVERSSSRQNLKHPDTPSQHSQHDTLGDDVQVEVSSDGDVQMKFSDRTNSQWNPDNPFAGSTAGALSSSQGPGNSRERTIQFAGRTFRVPKGKMCKPGPGGIVEARADRGTPSRANTPSDPVRKPASHQNKVWHKSHADISAELRAHMTKVNDVSDQAQLAMARHREHRQYMQNYDLEHEQPANASSATARDTTLAICRIILENAREESLGDMPAAVARVMNHLRMLECARLITSADSEQLLDNCARFLTHSQYSSAEMKQKDIADLINLLRQVSGDAVHLEQARSPLTETRFIQLAFEKLRDLSALLEKYVPQSVLGSKNQQVYDSAWNTLTFYEAEITPMIQKSYELGQEARDMAYTCCSSKSESHSLMRLIEDSYVTTRTMAVSRLNAHVDLLESRLRSLANTVSKQQRTEYDNWVNGVVRVVRFLNRIQIGRMLEVRSKASGVTLREKE